MAGIGGGMVGGSALEDELRRSNVVRLRGLSFNITDRDIADFFKGLELGPDGVVVCVNFQGRSTGQAFVQFASADVANKALERNRQHMGNQFIEVLKGHPADMQGALRMVGRGSANATGSIVNTGIPGMSGNPDMHYVGVIRMRSLPYSCTSADIIAFFKGMQIVPDGIFLVTSGDGRPTGEAYVEFINEETASRAMRLNKEPMGSVGVLLTCYIEIFSSTKGEMVTAVQQRMYAIFASLGAFTSLGQFPGMGPFGGFAGSPAGQSGPHGPGDGAENVCIRMRGLPYHAGVREILEFFEGYNIIPNGIHIVKGGGDRPTGEAFVEFASPEEAQRAMERNRQNIGSRYIELFRATKSEMSEGLSSFGMGQFRDPIVQPSQQQVATAGAFGMGGFVGAQAGGWADMQNAAAAGGNFYQRQTGPVGPAGGPAFDPSASVKMRGAPYRPMS